MRALLSEKFGAQGFTGLARQGIASDTALGYVEQPAGKQNPYPYPRRLKHKQVSMPPKGRMALLWKQHDANGNGLLSQSEARACVKTLWPSLHKDRKNRDAVLRMAYNAADDGGDGLIGKKEFPMLLEFIVYFNNLFSQFRHIDADGDGQLELQEFIAGCKLVGMNMTEEQATREFESIDQDGGGIVEFDEFCTYCARRHLGGWRRAKAVVDAVKKPKSKAMLLQQVVGAFGGAVPSLEAAKKVTAESQTRPGFGSLVPRDPVHDLRQTSGGLSYRPTLDQSDPAADDPSASSVRPGRKSVHKALSMAHMRDVQGADKAEGD